MGYACPVCAAPQRDGEHLAHHLAFMAMLHGDDHEAWLDEHAPDWPERDPAGLAADVTPHAEETEPHGAFEDAARERGRPDVDTDAHGTDAAADHARGHDHPTGAGRGAVDTGGDLDAETQAALAEARELTREMLAADEDADPDGDGTADAPDDGADPDDDGSTDDGDGAPNA